MAKITSRFSLNPSSNNSTNDLRSLDLPAYDDSAIDILVSKTAGSASPYTREAATARIKFLNSVAPMYNSSAIKVKSDLHKAELREHERIENFKQAAKDKRHADLAATTVVTDPQEVTK